MPGLGWHAEWQRGEVGLIRRAAVKTRIGTPANALIGPQAHLLVFDAAQKPFDKHVVLPSALAVHAERDAIVGEHAGKSVR